MSDTLQKKFLVLYHIPVHVMEEWAKTDAQVRQQQEAELMLKWDKWMSDHAGIVTSTESAGKTKRVTAAGITDVRNDIVMCSVAVANSHEDAAQLFKNHPHFAIPEASIEIMEIRPMA